MGKICLKTQVGYSITTHRQILFKSLRLGEMGMSQSKGETLLSVFLDTKELGSLVKNLSLKQRDFLRSSFDTFATAPSSEKREKSAVHHNIPKQHPLTA